LHCTAAIVLGGIKLEASIFNSFNDVNCDYLEVLCGVRHDNVRFQP
jgi:hypothetical protein